MIRRLVFAGLLSAVMMQDLHAQGHNLPLYDYSRRVHFGLMIGGLRRHLYYEMSDAYYRQDSLKDITVVDFPGVQFGPILDFHFGQFWDLRLIPALVLVTNSLQYRFFSGIQQEKKIESILIDAPLLVKYKSERLGNMRIYIIGGMKYSYDLASDEHSIQDPLNPVVPLRQQTVSWIAGAGFDFYLSFFKFSPELRVSRTLGNILTSESNYYADMLRKLQGSTVSLVIQFE